MMRNRTIAALCGQGLSITIAATMAVAPASAAETVIAFDIDRGTLSDTLARYAEQANVQLIYAPSLAAGRQSAGLRGRFTARTALSLLLSGTGIAVRQVDAGIFMLGVPDEGPHARMEPQQDRPLASFPEPPREDIVVTGSHIRGVPPSASPTKVIGRSEMKRNGYGSVAQALQAVPGNFSGMATEQSALSFADRSGSNATLASGVNLRGLGPDATLVLVNGRRVAGSGLLGDFADLSSIPMSALDRVEMVTDGASALYGSDAVAGVVNIILKQGFEAPETDIRLGSVTSGHAQDLQLSQTAGANWAGGYLFAAYEFQRRTGLRSADRGFARSADSRAYGGTDHRYPYSLPGNILGFSPSGALVPTYAIPAGQDGTNLAPGDFLAGVVNLENFRTGSDLSPDQSRHSLYARAGQSLADGIDLSLEGRFAFRRFDSRTFGYATILNVTRANPWFVSPTGARSDLIGYAFTSELGATRTAGSARSVSLTAALDADLGAGWKLSSYAGYAAQRDKSRTDRIANEYLLAEALGTIADDPLTAYSPARDGYFNPYGNGAANAPAIIDAIGGYTDTRSRSRIYTGDLVADGPLAQLPGGTIRFAVGGNYRHEEFRTGSERFIFSATPQASAPADYARDIWAGFAELNVPLFGADNAMPGLERLEFSAAVRAEHYDDFGSTTNPKLGLRWVPIEGIALRGSWGTSFRAPNLRELGAPGAVNPSILTNGSGNRVVVLQRSGGNPDLSPEKARSWTVGLDLEPRSLAGFKAGLTVFRTIFNRRIDLPALRNFSRALIDPTLAPFVRFVSPASNAQDRAFVEQLLAQAGGVGSYPINTIAAVVDTRYVNTGRVDVAGGDLDLAYAFERGDDHFSLGLSATYLGRWRERLTPTAPTFDRRNMAGRPVDLRGRATAGWSHGPIDALLGINHVDHYRDEAGRRIKAWNTVDLRLAYAPEAGKGPLTGVSLSLVAQNLFDKAPPFYDSTAGAGYDGANADATGRFLALEISKRW